MTQVLRLTYSINLPKVSIVMLAPQMTTPARSSFSGR
jgi:hypothetical protein